MELNEEQKLYVVERLAEMAPKWRVLEELDTLFNVKITSQALTIYDPGTKTGGDRLSPELAAHFHAHRKHFLADRSSIGLAHANYRLRRLQDLIDHEQYSMNPEFVKSVIEMAEKIDGGLYKVRVSEKEALEFIDGVGDQLVAAVDRHVTDPKERDDVKAEVKNILAGQGPSEPGK